MAIRLLCPRLAHVKILCVLTFIILAAFNAVIRAQSTLRLGIPSLSTTDGRFLAIAGTGASTLGYVPTIVYIGAADSLVVSLDLKKAWFSGVGKDGRRFDAYVEDNGESGINDVFLFAIDGVLQSGSGPVTKGNIQIHK